MWDQPPHAEILIGDKSHFNGDITGTEEKPDVIEFEHEFTEGEGSELIINRSGKIKGQTVINENGDCTQGSTATHKKHGDRRDRSRCVGVRGCVHSTIPRTMGLTTETSRRGTARIIQERHCYGSRWNMAIQASNHRSTCGF